jgi:hypothetical protein
MTRRTARGASNSRRLSVRPVPSVSRRFSFSVTAMIKSLSDEWSMFLTYLPKSELVSAICSIGML